MNNAMHEVRELIERSDRVMRQARIELNRGDAILAEEFIRAAASTLTRAVQTLQDADKVVDLRGGMEARHVR